jgi:hypothetical protein
MYHTHLGEIRHPSELHNVKALLNAYTVRHPFAFRYQDFVVTFVFIEPSDSGWGYSIEWTYKGRRYPAQEIHFNASEYALLLVYACCDNRLSFDPTTNIHDNRLSRADIVTDHGIENELLLHTQCVWFIIRIMHWIIQTRELDVYQFSKFHNQHDPRMDSFTRFFILQACRFIMATQFERIRPLDVPVDVSHLWTKTQSQSK